MVCLTTFTLSSMSDKLAQLKVLAHSLRQIEELVL